MKRVLFSLLLSAAALAPVLVRAQEKPSLNTAPPVPTPPVVTPAPAPVQQDGAIIKAPVDTVRGSYTPPAGYDQPAGALPAPAAGSPSGLELPGREQARKAAQQHAEMYSKLFVYTGAGISYSSNPYIDGGAFNVSVSPALGYRLNDRVSVGPGITYSYTNQTFGKGNPTLNLNNIGGKAFAQVMVYRQFFVHGEYEVTSAQLPLVDANGNYLIRNNQFMTGKRTIYSPLAGVGYRSQISTRVAADIVVLYNFNDSYNNSIYSNPVIRFNFLFNIGH